MPTRSDPSQSDLQQPVHEADWQALLKILGAVQGTINAQDVDGILGR